LAPAPAGGWSSAFMSVASGILPFGVDALTSCGDSFSNRTGSGSVLPNCPAGQRTAGGVGEWAP